jgi:uncharacterized protein YkwD
MSVKTGTAEYFFAALLFVASSGIAYAGSWTDADYDKYDYTTFAELDIAHARIDMKNIDYPRLHAAIFYATNRQRAIHKLPQFGHSPVLEAAAKAHSDDMVKFKFFSHTSPVKGKRTLADRLALVGIRNAYTGENIAESFGIEYKSGKSVYTPDQNGGYFSYTLRGKPIPSHTYIGFAKAIVEQWMNSSGHRANILHTKFKFLGTGASHFNKTDFFDMDNFRCTQNFASIKGD